MCSVLGRYFALVLAHLQLPHFFHVCIGEGGGRKQLIYIIYRKWFLILNVIIFHSIEIILFVAFNITS